MTLNKVAGDFAVFISYSRSDNDSPHANRRWLDRLLQHLEPLAQDQIIVWSDTEIELGEKWDESTETQLQNANVAVLLVSPAFLSSKFIRNIELPILLTNAKHKGVEIIPIVLRPSLFDEARFKYPSPTEGPDELTLSVFQSANPPDKPLSTMEEDEQDDVLRLVARRILALARSKTRLRTPVTEDRAPIVRLAKNNFFTGREQVLADLRRELTEFGLAALTGLPGIGKTQTALAYAHRHFQEYSAVLWVRADSAESLNSDLAALAADLNLSVEPGSERKESVLAVERWLEQKSGWLLVLDNADEIEIASDFLRKRWPGHILTTTQSHATGAIPQISLNVMEYEEGALLLLRRAKLIGIRDTLDAASDSDKDLARQINHELEGLPLALDQAGAYIEEMERSLEEYLELYRKEGNTLRAARGGYFVDHDAVSITFSLAFSKVAKANAAAADLLKVCAFLAPDAIPEDIFVTGASEMGQNLAQVTGGGGKLVEAVGKAGRFSLIRRRSKTGTLQIHRTVQQVLKDEMTLPERRLWAERAIKGVNATFPEVDLESWPLCEKLLPHALEALRLSQDYRLAFVESGRLLNEAGHYCFERAQYQEAERLFQGALAIREQVLGSEHPEVAMTVSNLASAYDHQGRYAEAESLFKRALSTHEQSTEGDPSDLALILNNMAASYDNQARYPEAKPLYERSLAIREATRGPNDPSVATSLSNLGTFYMNQGLYAEAEPLFVRSLAIREQELGPNHPDVAGSLSSLAGVRIHQARYSEAEALLKRSIIIREQRLGLNHPFVARSLNTLAALYEGQGRYPEAQMLLERSLEILETSLGPDHPKLAPVRQQYAALSLRLCG